MIECPICKNKYKSLMSHLRAHKLTVNEFRKKFPDAPLVSDETRKRASNTCKKRGVGKWMKGYKFTDLRKKDYSLMNSGENNPFYGQTHSEQSRQLMRENHADFTGDNNPLRRAIERDESVRERLSAAVKEGHRRLKVDRPSDYDHWRENLSSSIADAHIAGKLQSFGRGHTQGWVLCEDERIFCRSSYEIAFVEWCAENHYNIQPANIKIPYLFDGQIRNYVPDFILNELFLVEIKPKSRIKTKRNLQKFAAGSKYAVSRGLIFVILTEEFIDEPEYQALERYSFSTSVT